MSVSNRKRRRKRPTQPRLNADRPIETSKDDRLGRAVFAKRISKALCAWHGEQSLIVALYGGWGDGKTSVKGIIKEDLSRQKKDAPFVVDFNPWEWAGQDQISGAFFDEIAKQIGHKNETGAKQAAARMRIMARVLGLGKYLLRGAKFIIPEPATMAALEGAAGAAEHMENIADAGSQSQDSLREESLSDVKQKLRQALITLGRKIIVFIDDIDRLSADEIKVMIQLVKVNSDFPNLVFFLMFQRSIVEQALDKTVQVGNGRTYLEKIVQVSFDLPQLPHHVLHRIVRERLEDALAWFELENLFDWERWEQNYHDAIAPMFPNLRSVHRFFNSFEFQLGFFTGSVFEVNPFDFLIVELLRVSEPEAHKILSESKDLLFGRPGTLSIDDFDRPSQTRLMQGRDKILERLPEEKRNKVKAVLNCVIADDRTDSGAVWQRQLRLCSGDFFGRYFQLSVPEGDLPQSELELLMDRLGDSKAFAEALLDLDKRSLALIALERLSVYQERIKPRNAVPVATALFEVGDKLVNWREGLYSTGLGGISWWLIDAHMREVTNSEQRFESLKTAMSVSDGLYLAAVQTEHERFRIDGAKREPESVKCALALNQLQQLQNLCASKIKKAAEEKTLEANPHLKFLLTMWAAWDDSAAPVAWTTALAQRDPITVIRHFFGNAIEQDSQDSFIEAQTHPGLGRLRDIINAEKLDHAVQQLDDTKFTADQQRIVNAFSNLYTGFLRRGGVERLPRPQPERFPRTGKPDAGT